MSTPTSTSSFILSPDDLPLRLLNQDARFYPFTLQRAEEIVVNLQVRGELVIGPILSATVRSAVGKFFQIPARLFYETLNPTDKLFLSVHRTIAIQVRLSTKPTGNPIEPYTPVSELLAAIPEGSPPPPGTYDNIRIVNRVNL